MNTIIYLVIGLVVGGSAVYTYLHLGGKKRLKKFEEANEKKMHAAEKRLAEMEHKASDKYGNAFDESPSKGMGKSPDYKI